MRYTIKINLVIESDNVDRVRRALEYVAKAAFAVVYPGIKFLGLKKVLRATASAVDKDGRLVVKRTVLPD